jgi:hypothetical protein
MQDGRKAKHGGQSAAVKNKNSRKKTTGSEIDTYLYPDGIRQDVFQKLWISAPNPEYACALAASVDQFGQVEDSWSAEFTRVSKASGEPRPGGSDGSKELEKEACCIAVTDPWWCR